MKTKVTQTDKPNRNSQTSYKELEKRISSLENQIKQIKKGNFKVSYSIRPEKAKEHLRSFFSTEASSL